MQTRARPRRERRLAIRNYYFAYGSNLHPARLGERIGRVRLLSVAYLDGFRLEFHKQGRDGSGKCDIRPAQGARVIGALYEISREALLKLDRIEGRGYRRVRVNIVLQPGRFTADAWTYRARPVAIDETLKPMSWYRELVLTGARYHRLPSDYLKSIDCIETRGDTHCLRNRYARKLRKRRLRRTKFRGIVNSVT